MMYMLSVITHADWSVRLILGLGALPALALQLGALPLCSFLQCRSGSPAAAHLSRFRSIFSTGASIDKGQCIPSRCREGREMSPAAPTESRRLFQELLFC